MTTYKTIVRNLIKMYITDYLEKRFSGYVSRIRFERLTISEDKCVFVARVTINFIFSRVYIITGEVLFSSLVFIYRVEEYK